MPQHPRTQFNRQLKIGTQHLSRVSPHLRAWIRAHGPCTLEIAWERDLYESLVRAVAHQQLHGRAAETILGRLKAGFRGHPFPTPRQLARASDEKMRGFGFSAAKTAAILGIAEAATRGKIPSRAEAETWSNEKLIEELDQLRGVGPWTVEMLLIFTLGRLDVMPVADFGVQSGLKHLLELKSMPKKADFETHTIAWKPYRSIAAWYLWRKAEAARNLP